MTDRNTHRRPGQVLIVWALLLGLVLCGCAGTGQNALTGESSVSALPDSALSSAGVEKLPADRSDEAEPSSAKTQPEETQAPEQSSALTEETQAPEREVPPQTAAQTVLLFASDYQHRDGWKDPSETLSGVLDAVYEAGVRPDHMIFCGDYTAEDGHNNYNADPHDSIEAIKAIVLKHDDSLSPEQFLFVQGNHDERTEDISRSGLHVYEDYLVYVLNTETDYPWRQGKNQSRREVQIGAARLKGCLDALRQLGETRPVFLAAHVPLHFSGRTSVLQGTGDNLYAADLFEVINEAAEDLNLVYLYGHNHSRGWDSYLGGSCVFRSPGDWLLIPRPEDGESTTSHYSQETIHFTYLNAGYVGNFSSAGGEDTLTCSVCEIFEDKLVFSRYSEEGLHILSGKGTPNPAKDDRKLIPKEYYGEQADSPAAVALHRNDTSAETLLTAKKAA